MRVTIADEVYAEKINDEVVLLHLGSGQYYGLDAVGARLWALLGELGSSDAVVDAALREFDVSRDQLTRDLDELVEQLVARQLVCVAC